jgi:hypothetical protein
VRPPDHHPASRSASGFASIVSLVLSLLVIAALVVLYLRAFQGSTPEAAKPRDTLEGVRRKADAIEKQEAERSRAFDDAAGAPP